MKDLFPGYFPHDSTAIDKLWNDCTFIFDTSVLLDLYRFSEQAVRNIFSILRELDDVWIPNQVALEFFRNRELVLKKQYALYENFTNNLNGLDMHLKKHLEGLFSSIANEKYKTNKQNHPFLADIQELINTFEGYFEQIHSITDSIRLNLAISDLFNSKDYYQNLLENDWIMAEIVSLFTERTGTSFTEDELERIYIRGERRYSNKTPPGFLDGEKKEYDKSSYGDLIIWDQIIYYSFNNKRSVIFVTNDLKNDWWKGSKNKNNLLPLPELINEFQTKTSQFFWMYSFDGFLDEIETNKPHIKIEKIDDLKDEIQSVQDFDAERDFIEKRIFGKTSPPRNIGDFNFYSLMQKELNEVLETLPEEDKEILNYRYGLNGYDRLSRDKLSELLSLSEETIRELEARALRRIRHPKRSRRLKPFVDDEL